MAKDPDKLENNEGNPEETPEDIAFKEAMSKIPLVQETQEHDEHEHHIIETQEEMDNRADEIMDRLKSLKPSPDVEEAVKVLAKDVREIGSRSVGEMRNDLEDMITGNTENLDSFYSPEDAKKLYRILYGKNMQGESVEDEDKRLAEERSETSAETVARFEQIRTERQLTEDERMAYEEAFKRNYAEQEAKSQKDAEERGRLYREEAERQEVERQKAAQEIRNQQLEEERKAEEQRKSRWFGLGRFIGGKK